MRRYLKVAVLVGVMALLVAAVPSFAADQKATSGTWTFTDMSPNPSNFGECFNATVPSAPGDVNSYEVKVKKKLATLTTTSHNSLDWAAQITDKNGGVLMSADGSDPTTKENMSILVRKGTYTVWYCNWAGEPEITVDWEVK